MKSMQCPNCGQFKYVSIRMYYTLLGLAASGCGVLLLILPPLGLGVIVFGIIVFIVGIFANGRICTHCQYKTLPAA